MTDPYMTGFAWGAIAVLGLLLSFFGGYWWALRERLEWIA